MLRRAVAPLGLPVLGMPAARRALALPERHLGLVQAGEHARTCDGVPRSGGRHRRTARSISSSFDRSRAGPRAARSRRCRQRAGLPPLGQRIAVARDVAFAFAYPALLERLARGRAPSSSFFSPLADEAPAADADAVYLPGGYPELHAGRLAGERPLHERAARARRRAAPRSIGECGGYMVLGAGLVDADGAAPRHGRPAAARRPPSPSGGCISAIARRAAARWIARSAPRGAAFRGHEFHYAVVEDEGRGEPLFLCDDARGRQLGPSGRRAGTVFGSFLHLIDREEAAHARVAG